MRLLPFGVAALLAALPIQPVDSQAIRFAPEMSYADLADLALAAPVAAHVEVRRARALRPEDSPGVPPGHRRFLIEADVLGLIRGAGGLPPRVRYLIDLPNDGRGRAARIRRGTQFLVLASQAPGEPDELRLVAPDAQLPYGEAAAARIRDILRESVARDAPPRIAGIGRAFHVAGSLPGESETQIFLLTADERPISLTVLRRPGQRPRWAVALGEIVDQAAAPPAPDTLLWYRLACFLPPRLPERSLREAGAGEAQAIEADYRVVLEGLGRCVRNRPQR